MNYSSAAEPFTVIATQFFNVFENCIIYLLTWSFGQNVCLREVERFASFYSQKGSTPLIIESIFTKEEKVGPRLKHGYHSSSPSLMKYTSGCRVQIFLRTILTGLSRSRIGFNFTRTLIRNYEERLDYYVWFMYTGKTNMSLFTTFLRTVKDNAVTGKFIFVLDEADISLMCIFCPLAPPPQPRIFHDVNGLNRRAIDRLHRVIHSRAYGARLYAHTEAQTLKQSCSRRYAGLDLDGVSCSLYVITQHLNASIIHNDRRNPFKVWDNSYMGQVITHTYGWTYTDLRGYKLKVDYEWLSVGVFSHEYTFVTVLTPSPVSILSFLNAFSLQSWLVMLTTAVAMTMLVAILLYKNEGRKGRLLNQAVAVSVSLLLMLIDQYYFPGLRRRRMTALLELRYLHGPN